MRKEFVINAVTFTLVSVIGLAILLYGYMGMRPGMQYTTVSMKLAHTGQLSIGSPLLFRGVRIGGVTSLSPSTEGVTVSLRYAADYRLPVDSDLTIEQLSAFSEPYVEVAPRSDGGAVYRTGDTITAQRVNQSRPITEVFAALAAASRTADSRGIASLVNTAWTATSGNDHQLASLGRAGELVSATVLTRVPAIRSMFAHTQEYSGDLQWAPSAITDFGTAFPITTNAVRPAVDAVLRMVTTLNAPDPFVQVIDPFLVRLKPYLDELVPALATSTGPLASILGAVNRTAPQIDLSTLLASALHAAGADDAARITLTVPTP